ncbi:hypothetical protein LOTGIDRAFT_236532 [Lottia gigantea]|uniref:Uncharacterized protein n=1 Tax=Lottia gigantea TaxID=225164 RepID=V3ZH58_LOTGI|nr:hypothetical protein LOTGIDRAFT_236532 [Lottia gigantea]ESO83497.1 hypothetical protein LOTGIDRAFT_236532 [Lottia gigantea]
MGMNSLVNCTNNGMVCSQHLLQQLCVRFKPPDFPIWIHDVDKQQLLGKCPSWKTYSALCLGISESTTTDFHDANITDVTTDDYNVNVTDIDVTTSPSPVYDITTQSPSTQSLLPDITSTLEYDLNNGVSNLTEFNSTTQSLMNFNHSFLQEAINEDPKLKSYFGWIIPGITLILVLIIIIATIIIYKWYNKYSVKYSLESNIDYDNLHQKTKKKEKWKEKQSPELLDVEKCVMFVPSNSEIFISDSHTLGDKPIFSESTNNQIVDLQTQSFGEDPLYVLPNAYTEVKESNFIDDFEQDFSLPPLSLATTGLKGTLETGFINPAYEGTESIGDSSVPRKKKKRRFSFLKILRKTKK